MQIELIINGGVTILMSPENPLEEEAIKLLMKQDNKIEQFRSAVVVLNRTFPNGLVIGKKSSMTAVEVKEEQPAGPKS